MKYRFATFEIDTQQFTITDSGLPLTVEPKVFDVIVYLINHRHSVVSRDELFAQVWAGREVSDTTLSNHVKSARKLLGDNGDLQQVIKTVRGRGYQFIAKVEEHSELASPPQLTMTSSDQYVHPSHTTTPYLRLVKSSLILLLVISLITFAYWLLFPKVEQTSIQDKRPSIVVLPFEISSVDNTKWQPFAEQLTREVIRKLSYISALKVVPASSVSTLKQDKSLPTIRRKLPEVGYLVDAMISVNGKSDIRISTEMRDIQSNTFMWDTEFVAQIDNANFFTIQNDIAKKVADSLEIVLGVNEKHALSTLPTSDLAAYEFYVTGQQQLNMLNHQSLLLAIDLFDQAITLDKKFTLAYIAKADAYRLIMAYFEKPADVLPSVINAVNAALKLQPNSAEAMSSLGLSYVLAWRWEDAWKVLNKAKQLNPQLAQTELGFALYYAALGDKSAVKGALRQANKLDPLNIEIADWGHWALAMVGDIDAATKWSAEQLTLHPEVGMIYSGASVSASLRLAHDSAISLARKGVELDPNSPYAYLALAQAYGYAGQLDKISSLLKKARALKQYTCPYETAISFVILKDFDRAFSLFNEAISSRSNCLVFTRNDLRLEPIRQDHRYTILLKRIGLDDPSVTKYPR